MTVQIKHEADLSLLPKLPAPDWEALQSFVQKSAVSFTGLIDGKVACVVGLIPPTVLSERAYLWMLTTPLVDDHQFIFVRHTQRFLQVLLELYPVIVGHCEAGKERPIRWLRWLGAEFGEPEGKAIPFTIRAKKWTQ